MKKILFIICLFLVFILNVNANKLLANRPDTTDVIKVGESYFVQDCDYDNLIANNHDSVAIIKMDNRYTNYSCLITAINSDNDYYNYYDLGIDPNDFSSNIEYASIEEIIATINNGEHTEYIKEYMMTIEGNGSAGSTGANSYELNAGYYNGHIYFTFGYDTKEKFVSVIDYNEETHVVSYTSPGSYASSMDVYINDMNVYFSKEMIAWLMEISPDYNRVSGLVDTDDTDVLMYYLDNTHFSYELEDDTEEYVTGCSLSLNKTINDEVISNIEKENVSILDEDSSKKSIDPVEEKKEENPNTGLTISIVGLIAIMLVSVYILIISNNKRMFFK